MANTPRHLPWIMCGLAIALPSCAEDILRSLPATTDEFTQTAAAQVDILWVVDNSNSMAQEQAALGAAFSEFITQLVESQVQYHLEVINSDPADLGLLRTGVKNKAKYPAGQWPFSGNPTDVPFIDNNTINPGQAFAENVSVGVYGALMEEGMDTTRMALGIESGWSGDSTPSSPNADFIRSGAALFIIMVSDEDDSSYGSVNYYYRAFESYKGRGNDGRVSISAIVGPLPVDEDDPEDHGGCRDPERGAAASGERYIELAELTGGIATSICADFNQNLAELSYAAAGLKAKFGPLSKPVSMTAKMPCDGYDDQPLCIRINGQAVPPGRSDGWELITEDEAGRQNFIFFYGQAIPPPQSTITVEYMASSV